MKFYIYRRGERLIARGLGETAGPYALKNLSVVYFLSPSQRFRFCGAPCTRVSRDAFEGRSEIYLGLSVINRRHLSRTPEEEAAVELPRSRPVPRHQIRAKVIVQKGEHNATRSFLGKLLDSLLAQLNDCPL